MNRAHEVGCPKLRGQNACRCSFACADLVEPDLIILFPHGLTNPTVRDGVETTLSVVANEIGKGEHRTSAQIKFWAKRRI